MRLQGDFKRQKLPLAGTGEVVCSTIFLSNGSGWRSVKYEEVYLNDYGSVTEAWGGLNRYFNFYNRERFHQSLDYQTPEQVYFDGLANR